LHYMEEVVMFNVAENHKNGFTGTPLPAAVNEICDLRQITFNSQMTCRVYVILFNTPFF